MSAEAFLLFALAVIYCAISFGYSRGETSATRKREQPLIDRTRRQAPRYFKVISSERSDGRNMPGGNRGK
jgi:hypothetical protein